jgi:cobalt-zinc-cadmium efflux system membrane fusion protein
MSNSQDCVESRTVQRGLRRGAGSVADTALLALAVAASGIVLAALPARAANTPSAGGSEVRIELDDRGQRAAGIATSNAEPDQQGRYLTFPGNVVVPPHQSSVVASPAAGMIEAIFVAQDETVRPGQVIARLRSPQVVEAQHLFLAALTDEKLASDKLRRAEALFKVKAMSEVQLILARGEAAHAAARVDERHQILQLMGVSPGDIESLRTTRRISDTVDIHATREGTVIARSVNQGTRVEAAAPLFEIAQLSPLWVNIQVPTARMSVFQEGSRVTLPAQGARGRVIRIGRTIDPATQSIAVVAEIDTNGGSVRPGLAVSVNVRIEGDQTDLWSVPVASVVRHRGRAWVFVQDERGFRARPVELVSETGQRASIRASLSHEERIATQGVIALAAELAEHEDR